MTRQPDTGETSRQIIARGDDDALRTEPQYWMYETSGVLRPAIEAYLNHDPMTVGQIAAMRAYLRQWINNGDWRGPQVTELIFGIDGLTSREAIAAWIDAAENVGIDPL